MQAKDRLIEKIDQQATRRITFAAFMEAALYDPDFGYYRRAESPIGPQGDFFTAVSATPVFGRILAHYFLQLRATLGTPARFEIVEFGGHRGQFRQDVLSVAPEIPFRIVDLGDPTPETLTGCVFSNEFLDAMPVHRVKAVGGRWQELYVNSIDGGFGWETGPLSDPRLSDHLADLPASQMDGYETEINLQAIDWMERIGHLLVEGYVITIDYGFERHEYFSPSRPQGTLRCYHQHKQNQDPLQFVGQQDITAHVEFTSLIEAGKRVGLEPILFTDLTHFLVRVGEPLLREISERTAGSISRERQGLHQILHPGLMGSRFKVLVQKKTNQVGKHD